jgi:hypothetical protein
MPDWLFWSLLSAGFAALTAILAKAGLADVDSDYATLVRTVVILVLLSAFVAAKPADSRDQNSQSGMARSPGRGHSIAAAVRCGVLFGARYAPSNDDHSIPN